MNRPDNGSFSVSSRLNLLAQSLLLDKKKPLKFLLTIKQIDKATFFFKHLGKFQLLNTGSGDLCMTLLPSMSDSMSDIAFNRILIQSSFKSRYKLNFEIIIYSDLNIAVFHLSLKETEILVFEKAARLIYYFFKLNS